MAIGPYHFPLSPGTTYDPRGLKPEPDYSQPLQDVAELIGTIKKIRQQKAERNFYQYMMDELSKPAEKAETTAAAETIKSLKTPETPQDLLSYFGTAEKDESRIPELIKGYKEKLKEPKGELAKGGLGIVGKIGSRIGRIAEGTMGALFPTDPTAELEKTYIEQRLKPKQEKNYLDTVLKMMRITKLGKELTYEQKQLTPTEKKNISDIRTVLTRGWVETENGKKRYFTNEKEAREFIYRNVGDIEQFPEYKPYFDNILNAYRQLEKEEKQKKTKKGLFGQEMEFLTPGGLSRREKQLIPWREERLQQLINTSSKTKIFKVGEIYTHTDGKRYKVKSISGEFSPTDPDLEPL